MAGCRALSRMLMVSCILFSTVVAGVSAGGNRRMALGTDLELSGSTDSTAGDRKLLTGCTSNNVYYNQTVVSGPDANGYYFTRSSVHNTCGSALTWAYFFTYPDTDRVLMSQNYYSKSWMYGTSANYVISVSQMYAGYTHLTTGGADGNVQMAANSRVTFSHYTMFGLYFCPQHVQFANGDGQNIDPNTHSCSCNPGMGLPSVQCTPPP